MRCAIGYELPYGARLLKWGRTVYFPNHGCTVCEGEDFRMIVSPFDVLVPRRDAQMSSGPAPVRYRRDAARGADAASGDTAAAGERAGRAMAGAAR